MNSKALLAVSAIAVLLAAGCKNMEDYQNERMNYAVKHFERSQYENIDEKKTFKWSECVNLAVKNNLDLKVYGMEEKVAKEMRTSEMLGMLPELNVTDNLNHRNNVPASSSEQINGQKGPGTYTYSQSTDQTLNYLNVDLALSIVDFGLAFFNTQQANDRMLLRQQRTIRAEQNLVLDVTRTYAQVAASQRAIRITEKLLKDCRNTQIMIRDLGKSGKITPFRAFDESRRFMEMEKRLKNYIRSYENSCVELRSLMGLYPHGTIKVDDSFLDKVPDFKLPDMILLEQVALMQRPELFEIDMQKHINVLECRKTIVTMFPNVRIFLDFTNSTNGFLYHSSWMELGIRAAYNLLKLPQQIARYMAYSSQVDAEEYRTYAQAIAVMAQVRMAHANMLNMKEQYDINDDFYKAYAENLRIAEAGNRTSGELSMVEINHMRLTTAETEIERCISLGNYYVSYFRMLNVLGIKNLQNETVASLKKKLEAERIRAAEELKKAKADYEAEKKAAADKAAADKKAAELKAKEEAEKKAAADKKAADKKAKQEADKKAAELKAKQKAAEKAAKPAAKVEAKPAAKSAAPAKAEAKPAAKAAAPAKAEAKKEEPGFWSKLFGSDKKAETKPAAKTEAKPAAKAAAPAKAEAKPAAKPAAKVEAKPAAKPAAKVEAKPAAKAAAPAKAEAKPAAKPAAPAPAAKPAAKPAAPAPAAKPAAAPKTTDNRTYSQKLISMIEGKKLNRLMGTLE